MKDLYINGLQDTLDIAKKKISQVASVGDDLQMIAFPDDFTIDYQIKPTNYMLVGARRVQGQQNAIVQISTLTNYLINAIPPVNATNLMDITRDTDTVTRRIGITGKVEFTAIGGGGGGTVTDVQGINGIASSHTGTIYQLGLDKWETALSDSTLTTIAFINNTATSDHINVTHYDVGGSSIISKVSISHSSIAITGPGDSTSYHYIVSDGAKTLSDGSYMIDKAHLLDAIQLDTQEILLITKEAITINNADTYKSEFSSEYIYFTGGSVHRELDSITLSTMEQVPCLGDFDSTYFYLNEDGKISLIGSPSPTPQGGLYIAEDPEGVTNYIVNNEGQNIQWEGGLLSPTIQWDSGFSQLPATELIEDQKVNILVAKNHIGYRITLHELASFVRENTHELAMFIPFGLFNFEGGRFTVQLEGTGGSIFSSSVQDWTTQGMIFLLDTIGDFSNYNAAEYVFVGGSVTLTTVSGKTISENQMRVKNQDDRLLCCSAKEATDRVLYTIKLLQISYNSNTNRSSAVVQVTLDPNYTGETIKTVSNLSIHLTSASPKTSVVAGYVVTLPGDWTRYNVTITSPQPEYWVSDKQFFTSSDGIYGLWGYTII